MDERDNGFGQIPSSGLNNMQGTAMPKMPDEPVSLDKEIEQAMETLNSIPDISLAKPANNVSAVRTEPTVPPVTPLQQSAAPQTNYSRPATASTPVQPTVPPVTPLQQNAAPQNDYSRPATASTPVQPTVPPVTPLQQNAAPQTNYSRPTTAGTPVQPTASPVTPLQQNAAPKQTPPPQQTARKPVYDKFMYEPIGFEGYDRRAHIPPEQPQPQPVPPPPPQMPRQQFVPINNMSDFNDMPPVENEKTGLKLISTLIACSIIIGIIGIVYDTVNSKKVLENFRKGDSVVLYSEKKPEGANDVENYKDENGKYTTEGVAELVRPSIVEIYTYSDAAHKDLVGTGSGVVISEDGYIVTNAHVLESDGYHTIQTIDDDKYSATIIGRDVKTDIAVIQVNAEGLVPAVLGDSDEAVVGESVIAIGNPANLSSTVTNGIVSAVNRKIRSDSTGFEMDCIQTNADISPGNSGGALVNMYGQVIGITSSKYVSSSFEGLGFAITINEAKPIIEELINSGFIGGRFRIGISLIDMSTASKRKLIEEEIKTELPEGFEGVYISKIDKDADIANTDLKEGDFITEIDDTPVSTYDELYDTISSAHGAGDTVKAKCAHIEGDNVKYYKIEFKLMEDKSGNY